MRLLDGGRGTVKRKGLPSNKRTRNNGITLGQSDTRSITG